jgi:signal transduction histidine kinase
VRLPSKLVLADWALALVLTALTLGTLFGESSGVGWDAVVVSVLTVAPIAVRQTAPVLATAIILIAIVVASLLRFGDLPSSGIGIIIAIFSVAMLRPRVVGLVMLAAALLAVTFLFSREPDSFVWSQFAQAMLTVVGAWVVGMTTQQWATRMQRVAARAERAVADERARIARELHDVVAHHMSVISLQAGVAEYVLDSDRAVAREAIGVVNRSGREALAEMRRLLDVLRADADETGLRPQPGVTDVADLVARVSSAGLPVTSCVTGTVRELQPGAGLCVFRVVQESLTNVLKHAGPARARVVLDYGEAWLLVTISDDGRGDGAPGRPDTAHGIRGMRERAALYGGELSAGQRRGGGFEVALRLPLEAVS